MVAQTRILERKIVGRHVAGIMWRLTICSGRELAANAASRIHQAKTVEFARSESRESTATIVTPGFGRRRRRSGGLL